MVHLTQRKALGITDATTWLLKKTGWPPKNSNLSSAKCGM
jgi:hypothetical protein